MQHKPLDQLRAVADIGVAEPVMSRGERLKRWIDLLEAQPERHLSPLREFEYRSPGERLTFRSNDSPLTVAFEDPVLRAQGLRSDMVGDCLEFFSLSERDVHVAFCSCHVGTELTGRRAADSLRPHLARERLRVAFRNGIDRIRAFVSALRPAARAGG